MPINMITIRIKTLLLALLSAMCAVAQSADRHAIVVDQNIKTNPAKGEFATVNEALRLLPRVFTGLTTLTMRLCVVPNQATTLLMA